MKPGHVNIYAHVSLADFVTANSYKIDECWRRFLPLTIKSRFPVQPWLTRLYWRCQPLER